MAPFRVSSILFFFNQSYLALFPTALATPIRVWSLPAKFQIWTSNPQMLFMQCEPETSLRLNRNCKSRPGLSEIIGSLLAIAMTLVAGVTVFGYVNTQTGATEKQYGQNVGSSVNALSEKFVVVNANFSTTKVTLWLYNTGSVVLSPVQVIVYNSTVTLSYTTSTCASQVTPALYNSKTGGGLQVPLGSVQTLTITLYTGSCAANHFKPGVAYGFKVIGVYGNVVTLYQTR